jgi:3-phosphoshikimate 1-carboxyvinyltransferase
MQLIRLSRSNRNIGGDVVLDGSKSISNRALIALTLAGAQASDWLMGLSNSKDTLTLRHLLAQQSGTFDAGDAGTTFRFMTAYLALQPGEQILTGSPRMRERPVGGLVRALRSIGANIDFLEKEGYPPLRIKEMRQKTGPQCYTITVDADTSSQFLSALLLIGPYLPNGLRLAPAGSPVSKPYVDMTLSLMRFFGADARWEGATLVVKPGHYTPRPFTVEADWSAASYWYALAALADEADLRLYGLSADSWQGDSVVVEIMQQFGVLTRVEHPEHAGASACLRLSKPGTPLPAVFQWDFTGCPDIAQTLAVTCAGLGVQGQFTGLETLSIKETDRVTALTNELGKVGVSFSRNSPPQPSQRAT